MSMDSRRYLSRYLRRYCRMIRHLHKESHLSQEEVLRTYKLAADVLRSETSAIKQDTAQILREIA